MRGLLFKLHCLQACDNVYTGPNTKLQLNAKLEVGNTKPSSALYVGMAKVLPVIDVLGYDGQSHLLLLLLIHINTAYKSMM